LIFFKKKTFFSDSYEATLFDSFEQIYVEMATNAMQKLAHFIGKRKYKTSFV
jgi:hypothetical protein